MVNFSVQNLTQPGQVPPLGNINAPQPVQQPQPSRAPANGQTPPPSSQPTDGARGGDLAFTITNGTDRAQISRQAIGASENTPPQPGSPGRNANLNTNEDFEGAPTTPDSPNGPQGAATAEANTALAPTATVPPPSGAPQAQQAEANAPDVEESRNPAGLNQQAPFTPANDLVPGQLLDLFG